MNRPASFLRGATLLGALALGLAAASVFAQTTAYSPPIGGLVMSVAAGTPSAPFTTSFSVPLQDIPAASGVTTGKISSVAATSLTVTGAGWTSGALTLPGFPYAVRLQSGQAAGLTLTVASNTADTLTVNGVDLTALNVAAGDRFTLIPVDTLSTLFGSSTLLGGATAADADIVTLSSTSQLSYYYNTTLGRWVRTSGPTTDRGSTPIPPDTMVSITRKSDALSLVFLGQVPTSRTMISVANSGSTYTNTGFPISVTLGALALQSRISGWVSAPSAASADLLGINSGGAWTYYFHNGTNWQRTSGPATNRDTVPVPVGAAIQIFKAGIASGNSYFIREVPFAL
jgi:uncharacterized protein (TIGR02597 family)